MKAHAHEYGGDPQRIFLVGHSAGAAHVAAYVSDPVARPAQGPGVAGIVLISGRLRADVLPDNPNARGVRAYYGDDPSLYEARSCVTHAANIDVPLFIAIAQYEKAMNFKVTRVSYAGFAPTVTALLAAEIDSATVPIPDTIEHHKGGKLKILGVSATERHYLAPDVPTFKEQGFDVVVGSWRCIVGPKGMPADRIAFLQSNLLAVLEDPEFKAKAKAAGFIVGPRDAKATAARWRSDDTVLYPILQEAGLVKVRQK